MSSLTDAVRELAACDRRSAAVLVRAPDGEYLVSRDGTGGDVRNAYVVSRSQLAELMHEAGLRRVDLASLGVRRRLAGMVAAFAADRAHHASLAERARQADRAGGR